MNEQMVMVQWADLTGGGFRRHEVGAPAAREYWAAAEQLLQSDLSQPPEGIRSTVGHPVWTLRRVAVRGRSTWCFIVQGRRGPFGVAGSCRFAFAPEQMPALEAWRAGRAVAAADYEPIAGLPATDDDLGTTFADVLGDVLGALVVGRPAVPVDVPPELAAVLIPRVIAQLPETVAQAWSWSTCTLKRPEVRRLVSGRWPDDFRLTDPARAGAIDQIFRNGIPSRQEVKQLLASEEATTGLEWLVDYALKARRPRPELLAYGDLNRMVVDLGQEKRPPDVRQVPLRLTDKHGRRTLHQHPHLVRQWAAEHPRDAQQRIGTVEDDPALYRQIVYGLVEAQSSTADNVMELPDNDAPGLTKWAETLADELKDAYPRKELRAMLLGWTKPGHVYADLNDRAAARDWFHRMGFTPDHEPLLFEPRPQWVAATVNQQHGTMSPPVSWEIQSADHPLSFVESLADQLAPMRARDAAELIVCATTGMKRPGAAELHGIRGLAHTLTVRLLTSGSTRASWEPWVEELLSAELHRQRPHQEVRAVMYGAMTALLEKDNRMPGPRLMQLCQNIGIDRHPPASVAELFEVAARTTVPSPPPTRPESRSSPDIIYGQPDAVRPHPDISHTRPTQPAASGERSASARPSPAALFRRLGTVVPLRTRVPIAIGLACGVAGILVGLAIGHGRPGDAPEGARSPSATAPAPVQRAVEPVEVALGTPQGNGADQARRDRDQFRSGYRPPRGATPAALVLVTHGDDAAGVNGDERANRLIEELQVEGDEFAGVPSRIVRAWSNPDQVPGSLQVVVYYNR